MTMKTMVITSDWVHKRLSIIRSPKQSKEKRWPNKHTQVRAFSSCFTGVILNSSTGRKENFFKVVNDRSLCRVVVLPPTRGDEPRRPGPMSSWNISYPLNAVRRSSCSLERRFINPLRVYDSLRARDSPLPLFLSLGRVGSSMTAYFCLSHYW